jgi:hypothetical protein
VGGRGRLQLLLPVQGRGTLTTPHGEEPLTPGEVWVLPAAAAAQPVRPDGSLAYLLCTLPD